MNGIVWIMQANVPNDTVLSNPSPAVLRAYDATNLAVELYNSTQGQVPETPRGVR